MRELRGFLTLTGWLAEVTNAVTSGFGGHAGTVAQATVRESRLVFPVLNRGSGSREHDVVVLGVLRQNLSGVEVLDDFAGSHRGEHEDANRRFRSVDDLMRTVLASRTADDIAFLQHMLAFACAE